MKNARYLFSFSVVLFTTFTLWFPCCINILLLLYYLQRFNGFMMRYVCCNNYMLSKVGVFVWTKVCDFQSIFHARFYAWIVRGSCTFFIFWQFFRTKKPPILAGKFQVGGAAGYCLRVRVTTWTSFYVHSFLFRLGINRELQKTKLTNAIAKFSNYFSLLKQPYFRRMIIPDLRNLRPKPA